MERNRDFHAITRWNKLTLSNNFMFRLVMEKQELCKKLIECILGIKIKSLSYVEHEKSFEANLQSKGIRLDLFVIDEDGVAYDIEMQMDNSYKQFLGRRTRYYVSLMDNKALKKGDKYSKLRKSYVIFICTFDPFDRGLAKYTFNAICNEDHSLVLDDGVKTQPAVIHVVVDEPGRTVLEITLHEGRNRQIRRMCEAVGLEVIRLKRSAEGPVKLGMLQPGEYRELKKSEISALRNAALKAAPARKAAPAAARRPGRIKHD